ncbi:hypothetical protein [Nocardia sp. NPDC057440]
MSTTFVAAACAVLMAAALALMREHKSDAADLDGTEAELATYID